MTVRDFISKCKEIDPLVCMGIESFVETNKAKLQEPAAVAHTQSADQDLNFSNVVSQEPQMAAPEKAHSFSLNQSPDVLNFPA